MNIHARLGPQLCFICRFVCSVCLDVTDLGARLWVAAFMCLGCLTLVTMPPALGGESRSVLRSSWPDVPGMVLSLSNKTFTGPAITPENRH